MSGRRCSGEGGFAVESSFTTVDGHTLRIIHEETPVNYLNDIDANWRFTDAVGHEHHCEYEAIYHWPTLREVVDNTSWCEDCEDNHEDTHFECRLCGEHITPGMTGPGTKFIQGMTLYFIDNEPVTKTEAEEFVTQMRRLAANE
jgi:hypothetical protein